MLDIGNWINGAINATSNAVGTVGGMIQGKRNLKRYINFQREENQATREWNLNLAKMQNQWNIDQWNRENEYNTPLAQGQRYAAAGMNPDLLYGQSNLSANSPTLTSGEPATPMDYSPVASQKTIGDYAAQFAQTRLINSQAKLAESQANKTDKETDAQGITNEWLPKLLKGQVDDNEATIKQKLADAGLKGKQIEVAAEQILSMQQSVKESQERINMLQKQMENITFDQVQRMLDYNLRKDKQHYEILEILSKVGVNRATSQRIISLMPYEIAESISRTNVNDATAALTFLRQGTEMIIKQNLRLSNSEKAELLKSLQWDNQFKESDIKSYFGDDGKGDMNFIARCFRSLGDAIKYLSPLK